MNPLTHSDRCDFCQAQAFMSAKKGELSELLFCGHHGSEYFDNLVIAGFVVHDYRDAINVKPSMSSV